MLLGNPIMKRERLLDCRGEDTLLLTLSIEIFREGRKFEIFGELCCRI